MALEGPKIAPHTYIHWGYCSTVREQEGESKSTQHGWGEEGKYRSAEGERGGSDEGTSGTENEKDMT